jgi:glycosyltransferase involved in cell wall biosynthesis
MNKKAFIISYAFPPSGGAGVRRILKTIKYLSQLEWEITVLSPKRGRYFAYPYDPLLLEEIPANVQVVECFTPERYYMTQSVSAGEGVRSKSKSNNVFSNIYRKIYRLIGDIIAVPESAIIWLPFAVWYSIQLIRQNDFEVIFVTSPPFSSLLIGGVLKKVTGLPLVIEFRDAWIAEPTRKFKSKWAKILEFHQESWTIRIADYVISVTDGITHDFIKRYGNQNNREKFITIPNGYDRDDLKYFSPESYCEIEDNLFKIVYTGTLGGRRTPRFFFAGLKKLIQSRPELRSKLKVFFIGRNGRFMDGYSIEDYIEDYGLNEIVEIVGFVSREESFIYQAEADLLLLLIGLVAPEESQCYGISAKVFDYILAGKPILAVTEDGPTAEFMREAGIGEVISHYDEFGISAAVERAIDGQMNYAPNQKFITIFDYSTLARNLNQILLLAIENRDQKDN